MAKDASKSTGERIFQILGVLIPISTFVLGYGLSSWERYSDKQDRNNNLRYIYGVELAMNLENLAKVQPPKNTDKVAPPNLISILANNLSTEVYDAYMSELADLSTDESRSIFDAYQSIRTLKVAARDYLASESEEESTHRARATGVIVFSQAAYRDAMVAASVLPVSKDRIKAINDAMGDALEKYEAFQPMFDEMKRKEEGTPTDKDAP